MTVNSIETEILEVKDLNSDYESVKKGAEYLKKVKLLQFLQKRFMD